MKLSRVGKYSQKLNKNGRPYWIETKTGNRVSAAKVGERINEIRNKAQNAWYVEGRRMKAIDKAALRNYMDRKLPDVPKNEFKKIVQDWSQTELKQNLSLALNMAQKTFSLEVNNYDQRGRLSFDNVLQNHREIGGKFFFNGKQMNAAAFQAKIKAIAEQQEKKRQKQLTKEGGKGTIYSSVAKFRIDNAGNFFYDDQDFDIIG